jgi:hypothetical protein
MGQRKYSPDGLRPVSPQVAWKRADIATLSSGCAAANIGGSALRRHDQRLDLAKQTGPQKAESARCPILKMI